MNTKTTLLICLLLTLSSVILAQNKVQSIGNTPLTIGVSVDVHSKILGEKRKINVYLPNGYAEDSTKKYPVIYLLDGSIDQDFVHIAGLVQFGSFSWINMIPESIVVGIANVDRRRDFTFPSKNKKDVEDNPTSGDSEAFIDFIDAELQPFIASHFHTSPVKTLIGQSLGGLLATEILFKKPELFDNYIIISPSLWWNDESLLKHTPTAYENEKSIYIAVGKEGEVMERTARALFEKVELDKKANTKVCFQFFEKQNHGDVLHLAVYDAFEKLFRVY